MRIMRRPRGLVAVVAGCVLLAGCGAGPSQVGAAAIVGGGSASIDDVQAKLDSLVKTDPYAKAQAAQHKLDDLARAIVTREVQYRLVDEAAVREKLPVDESKLAAFLPNPAAQQGTDDPSTAITNAVDKAFDPQDVARHSLLLSELGAKYIGKVSLVVDAAQLPDAAQAKDLAARIALDPSKSDQVMNQAGLPSGSIQLNAAVPSSSGDSVKYDAEAGSVIFAPQPAAPDGSSPATNLVIVVKKVTFGPLTVDISGVSPQDMIPFGTYLLRQTATAVGLKVNPRYGAWDSLTMQIGSATEIDGAGSITPPRSSAP
jgi:hypothetical protein